MLDIQFNWTRGTSSLAIGCTLDAPIIGMFGPSGAGKSSVLEVISGLARPDAGRVVLDSTVLFDSARSVSIAPHRRRIGMMFQETTLFPHYDVRGNLRYGWRREHDIEWEDVIDLLALSTLLDRRIDQLSGGEKQRVALGRALLSGPRLLLLDEPLASLDVGLKRQILPFLAQVNQRMGVPMILVSHDITEILQLTTDLVVLDEGRVVSQGAFHEVMSDHRTFQLARRLGLDNVLSARVVEHAAGQGLTCLDITLDQKATPVVVWGPLLAVPVGTMVHFMISPEDIAVALRPVTGTSIRNQLPGRVSRLIDHDGMTLLEVDVGRFMLVEISPRSAAELGLAAGTPVTCLFKAVGVRYVENWSG